jgi:hypothetical protein
MRAIGRLVWARQMCHLYERAPAGFFPNLCGLATAAIARAHGALLQVVDSYAVESLVGIAGSRLEGAPTGFVRVPWVRRNVDGVQT